MKLVDFTDALQQIVLPGSLLWEDEFSWSPVLTTVNRSISGALLVQRAVATAGRPITLVSPSEMAWVSRSTLETLRTWAASGTKKMVLHLEKSTDTRTFTVEFADGNNPIEASPVKGWADHLADDPYTVRIRLIQV